MKYWKILIVSVAHFIVIILFLSSCHFTTTKPVAPVFTITNDSLAANLSNLVMAQNVDISGTQETTDGKKSTTLTITILNGTVPAADDARSNLGRRVAQQVKQVMSNAGEFSIYEVVFKTEEKSGLVTKSKSISYEYAEGDL